jgi:tetratricopeptide (TPR) repeat protein
LIGGALKKGRDLPGALASYQAAIADYEKVDSSKTFWQRGLSLAHRDVGLILEDQGDLAGALASYRASQGVEERLTRIDPADDVYQGSVAWSHRGIAGVLQKQGNLTDALASYRAALAIDEEQLEAKPGDTERQKQVAVDHSNVGNSQLRLGDLAGALSSYRAALAGYGKLEPDTAATQESLRSAHYYIGYILHAQGNLAGALASFQAGLALNERLASADPGNADRQRAVCSSRILIGKVLHDQGRLPQALASYSAAEDIAQRRFKEEPRSSVWASNLASAYSGLAEVRFVGGDRAGALALWRKALTIVEASTVTVEEEEIKSAGKPGPKTAAALTSVEWRALLARDTSKVISAWERAGALVPELNPAHHINRAHAFLFRNRLHEARAIYLANKSKLINGSAAELVIADDFRALRRAGLTHPMMREVEVALGVAPAQVGQSVTAASHRAGK